jgi:hypothetical protein
MSTTGYFPPTILQKKSRIGQRLPLDAKVTMRHHAQKAISAVVRQVFKPTQM